MIGLVTDSNSQIPASLVERFGVEVVPVIVNVDGVVHREGIDIGPDDLFERWIDARPEITTSQPSPGEFVEAYRRVLDRGAESILSVHVGSEFSGTLNSARLAAAEIAAPVRLVDSGTVSFGITCALWQAAEAIAGGATLEEAATIAERIVPEIRTVFILQALDITRAGGRLPPGLDGVDDAVPVLMGTLTDLDLLATGHGLDELCDAMIAPIAADRRPLRVGVCLADEATMAFTERLESDLAALDHVTELVRYRVGPSVAAHTGPGTAGAFWFPVG